MTHHIFAAQFYRAEHADKDRAQPLGVLVDGCITVNVKLRAGTPMLELRKIVSTIAGEVRAVYGENARTRVTFTYGRNRIPFYSIPTPPPPSPRAPPDCRAGPRCDWPTCLACGGT
jgi:hypothetical protein